MNTYISLLRGINVTGNKVIKMADLQKLYESLKFKNVQTYIASGNVVFQSPETDVQKLRRKIQKKIQEKFGFDVGILVITPKQLEKAIKQNPFPNAKPNMLCFNFLSEAPANVPMDEINARKDPAEQVKIIGDVLYHHCPIGFGKTDVTNAFLEKKLNVVATARNWNTVNKLLEMGKEKPI
jgi:uncharacterized protein (DUF1697 family)